MRRFRPLLVAGILVALAAGVGTTVALTTRSAPVPAAAAAGAAGAAGEPAAVPAAAPSGPTTSTGQPDTGPQGGTSPDRGANAAVATARAFLARELGMTDLVALPVRSIDARTVEVGFRHKHGEGGRLLPQNGPAAVTVRLYRLPAGWWVLGVHGRSIRADAPARLQRISSPLTVSGKAEVYEGTVYVKVTQDRPGRDLVLGQGFVTGGGGEPGAFRGQIPFRQPTSTAPGWVTYWEESAATGGGVLQASMVRVQFAAATPAPRILAVTSKPRLRTLEGGWLELPDGAGTVILSVDARNAQRVRFVLTPTGTGTGPYGKLLGEDRDPRDGFALTWHYPDQSLSAHLTVQATGPGGTTEKLLDIVHP
jgi:Immunoglobulin-like domain of bacterial spore germination